MNQLSGSVIPNPLLLARNLEFEDDQNAHQQSRLQVLRSVHQEIVAIMTQIHTIFAGDGAEVGTMFLCFSMLKNHFLEY